MYLPPLLETLGLADLTHDKRNNSMKARPTQPERTTDQQKETEHRP